MVNRYNNRCGVGNRGGSGRMPFSEGPRDINMMRDDYRGNWQTGQQYTRGGGSTEPMRSNMRQSGPVRGDTRRGQYGTSMQNPMQRQDMRQGGMSRGMDMRQGGMNLGQDMRRGGMNRGMGQPYGTQMGQPYGTRQPMNPMNQPRTMRQTPGMGAGAGRQMGRNYMQQCEMNQSEGNMRYR